jgi:hypothetical protein
MRKGAVEVLSYVRRRLGLGTWESGTTWLLSATFRDDVVSAGAVVATWSAAQNSIGKIRMRASPLYRRAGKISHIAPSGSIHLDPREVFDNMQGLLMPATFD